jgi:putative sterol carrier protein
MDDKALAYINLHAVLGSLNQLCELDDEAKRLIKGEDVSIGFSVKDGPEGTLVFKDGKCDFVEGTENCTIKLPFSTPKKFNGMIDGTVTPIPSKGFTKIGFLLKKFTKLTDILTSYLRPEDGALDDERFFEVSTTVMFYLIVEALAQVGNVDKVGMFSAGNTVDGNVKIAIKGGPSAYIKVENHHLTPVHEEPKEFMSYMVFEDMHIARDLFDGKVNAIVCVGTGKVRVGGMMLQVDNINRMLDRVALYLS